MVEGALPGAALVFLASLGFTVYILLGYPVLLALLARHDHKIDKHFEPKTVSVLLCVYNGEPWIRDKLLSILHLDYPRDMLQVIVISDGSSDGTDDIVRQFARDGVELLRVPHGGKAAALNAGLRAAGGEILFFTDVRQPLDPGCLMSLVSCLGDPSVGAACGHIYFLGSQEEQQQAHMGLYWRYEKWIRLHHTRIHSIQAGTGCIYAMRRELTAPIPPDTLLDDSYLPLCAFFRGYRFVFDMGAIAYEYPTTLDTEFRRKVRTLAGIYQLIGIFPALVGSGNRMWIHFVSHKLGRLLMPFALILMAISSLGLPGGWRVAAVTVQVACYLLAALDPRIPKSWPIKRLSSLARTFVVLMAASLCAVAIFFVPARKLWKETRVAS
jgi:cellulose synthase/poly-beta-1,6-N-acetylglucosamine synthase-like glycosyltransferase